jgi:PIN domain nuclease of toxin-antitoxin system
MGVRFVIVADTHIVVWHALDSKQLSAKARRSLKQAEQDGQGVLVSEISLWEIALLMKRGRLQIDCDYLSFIDLIRAADLYRFINITPEIAFLSANLPDDVNRDPADRLICATALTFQAELVTADKNLRKAKSVATIW